MVKRMFSTELDFLEALKNVPYFTMGSCTLISIPTLPTTQNLSISMNFGLQFFIYQKELSYWEENISKIAEFWTSLMNT